jgi:hypothetical protein
MIGAVSNEGIHLGSLINIEGLWAVVEFVDHEKQIIKFSKTFKSKLMASRHQHDTHRDTFKYLHPEDCKICLDDAMAKL